MRVNSVRSMGIQLLSWRKLAHLLGFEILVRSLDRRDHTTEQLCNDGLPARAPRAATWDVAEKRSTCEGRRCLDHHVHEDRTGSQPVEAVLKLTRSILFRVSVQLTLPGALKMVFITWKFTMCGTLFINSLESRVIRKWQGLNGQNLEFDRTTFKLIENTTTTTIDLFHRWLNSNSKQEKYHCTCQP